MAETYAEQRDRIIAENEGDVDPEIYDMFVDLGYQPESWDGMWKLPRNPIVYRGMGVVIFREVVYQTGTHNARYVGRDVRAKTRLRMRRDPSS